MNNTIELLNNKLNLVGLPDDGKYDKYFSEIADLLMNHCLISKGDNEYEIVEIEFYLFTPEHQDVITYPREIGAGMWFFHQSGVDLTFSSDNTRFGGILIQGIRLNKEGSEPIIGPIKCVNELWDKFNALAPELKDFPKIKQQQKEIKKEIKPFVRKITVPKSKEKERVAYWAKRVKGKVSLNEDELIDLVFNSRYQFRAY